MPPCRILFGRHLNGSWILSGFNETDDPIDNVAVSITKVHAEPEYKQDTSLIIKDLTGKLTINVGTLLPQLATEISIVPEHLVPNTDRPTIYQLTVFTRYEAFTESLYVTPGQGASFDQAVDISSNKTHESLELNTQNAMKRWKNWPEWWK